MEKIKKVLLFRIPTSICNFRCEYCYLAQRDEHYQGVQPKFKYSPEDVAKACSKQRIGGLAYINFCADGETLLTKNIDEYIRLLAKEGHYIEIVTNMTVTPVIDKILNWPKELLKHIEFKASFHYLELKKRNLLEIYAKNVQNAWKAGASVNIEITPSDDLIPYIEEVKEFSLKYFGALPHLSIARNDTTNKIEYLTNLSQEEYNQTWEQFDSEFWRFKKTIFGKYQNKYCYAGKWSAYVDLTTGIATPCYCGLTLGDVFANPDKPFPESPIGKCGVAHCYNGHALMTLGLIPGNTSVRYGDIRDRQRDDGTNWLQPELKDFFNGKLEENNDELSMVNKSLEYAKSFSKRVINKMKQTFTTTNR